MGLLQKLKSLFGSGGNRQQRGGRNEADVTVEREPSAESEHAVKGTGGQPQQGQPRQGQPRQGQPRQGQPRQGQPQQGQPQQGQPRQGQPQQGQPQQGQPQQGQPRQGQPQQGQPQQGQPQQGQPQQGQPQQGQQSGDAGADEKAGTDETADDASPDLKEIKGIGPTYADRLSKAGYETVADLAAADPEAVAEAAQTGEGRASDWIDRARDF